MYSSRKVYAGYLENCIWPPLKRFLDDQIQDLNLANLGIVMICCTMANSQIIIARQGKSRFSNWPITENPRKSKDVWPCVKLGACLVGACLASQSQAMSC